MSDEHGEGYQEKHQRKTIYDTGFGSIFLRNFVAGFSRALGTIFVYLMLGGLLYYLSVTYVAPQLQRILPTTIPLPGVTVQPGSEMNMSPDELQEAIKTLQQNPR